MHLIMTIIAMLCRFFCGPEDIEDWSDAPLDS